MQRLFLAILFLALVAGAVAVLIRWVAQVFEKSGGTELVSTGSAMQRISFFLLLCLMIYVSMSGAS